MLFPMKHAGAGDSVAPLASGAVADDFAQALASQEKQRIADFGFAVIKTLSPGDLSDVFGGNGNLFAAVKLQQAFVADVVIAGHRGNDA